MQEFQYAGDRQYQYGYDSWFHVVEKEKDHQAPENHVRDTTQGVSNPVLGVSRIEFCCKTNRTNHEYREHCQQALLGSV